MAMPEVKYTVILEPGDPREGGFTVSVPALPEAHTQGDTLEEALANAREVIEACILARRDRDREIPASDAGLTRIESVTVTVSAA